MSGDARTTTQLGGDIVVAEAPKKTVWQAFRSFIWDSDSHLKSAAERRMLFKLDLAMLPCLCLGFFCKYLDQNNISRYTYRFSRRIGRATLTGSAYVSGMREDLGWYGNQYTYAVSMYTAAYAIMQIPSTVIVQYVKPSWWLAFCEIGWGCVTIAQAGAQNTETMYGLRFAIGILESAFFPVGLFLLGSWYTPTELAKRTAIFHFTAPAGTAFGGYLQAAIYTTMDGHLGWPGWRWLYIFCGIITVPCGILVIFVLPNYPTKESGKPWFLTQEEFELAQDRMKRINRVQSGKVFKAVHLKRIFSGWHVYVLPLTYILYGLACQATGYFNIFLKSTGEYSIVQVNIYPTFLSVIQIITVPLWGFLSDYHGDRFTWSFGPTVFSIISGAILAAWPNNNRLIMAGFYLGGCQFVTAIIYSWWNEICHKDPMERALAIGLSNGLQYAMSAWLPIVIFPQVEAPSFRKGFPTTLAFTILASVLLVVVKFLWAREQRLHPHGEEAAVGVDRRDSEDELEKQDKQPVEGSLPEALLPASVDLTDSHTRK